MMDMLVIQPHSMRMPLLMKLITVDRCIYKHHTIGKLRVIDNHIQNKCKISVFLNTFRSSDRNYHTITTTTVTQNERPFVSIKRAHEQAKLSSIGVSKDLLII